VRAKELVAFVRFLRVARSSSVTWVDELEGVYSASASFRRPSLIALLTTIRQTHASADPVPADEPARESRTRTPSASAVMFDRAERLLGPVVVDAW
jgi:hypothetical protein